MFEKDEPLDTRLNRDKEAGSNEAEPSPAGGGQAVISQLRKTRGIRGEATVRPEDPREALSISGAAEGRYTEIGEIARGGMGIVVKMVDNDIRRPVAMKVILSDDDPARLERFVEEAQITGQLEHPNIVPVHEINVDGKGRACFTMKLVRGETLESIVERIAAGDPQMAARYPLTELLRVFLKVCDAVSFAHSRGVIHRDLKPENIMVGKFGEVLVMDWGLAKIRLKPSATTRMRKAPGAQPAEPKTQEDAPRASAPDAAQPGLTREGQIIGTPAYMAPEQALGLTEEITPRSDVFALGGILYKILTHQAPYDAEDVAQVLDAAARRDLPEPRRRAPHLSISKELESVCMKAMAPASEARYESAQALTRDVQAYLDRRAVEAHRYGPAGRAVLFVQRNPASSLAAAVAAVLLFAFSALGLGLLSAKNAAEMRAKEKEALAKIADARAEAQAFKAKKAENDRDAAQTNLAKARLVATLLKSAEDSLGQRISDVRYPGAASQEQLLALRRGFWKAVEEFESRVPSDSSSRSAWLAVKGLCARYSGIRSDAEAFFEESRRTDPDVACADLFEGLAWFVEYVSSQPVPALSITESGVTFEETPDETPQMRVARRMFEEALARARGAGVWGDSAVDDFSRVLAGFRAMHSGDLDAAEAGLSMGLNLPETSLFRDDITLARAILRYQKKDFSGSLRDVDEYLSGVRNNAFAWYVRGSVCGAVAAESQYRGMDAMEPLRDAVDSFSRSLDLDPGLVDAAAQRGAAYARIGAASAAGGLEFSGYFDRAVADLEKVATANPGSRQWAYLARTRQMYGEAIASAGGDPMEMFGKSKEAGDKAVGADQQDAYARMSRCIVNHKIAERMLSKGEDAQEKLSEVFSDLEAVLETDPGNGQALRNKAAACYLKARILQTRGRDHRPALMEMISIYDSILARHDSDAEALYNRAVARNDLARASAIAGADPRQDANAAIADLDRSLALRPRSANAHSQRGLAFDTLAGFEHGHERDPRELYAKAASCFEQALDFNPRSFSAAAMLGNVLRLSADYSIGLGLKAGDELRRADKALAIARDVDPGHAQLTVAHGTVLEKLGRYEDAKAAYAAALALAGGKNAQIENAVRGLDSILSGPAWNVHRAMGNAAMRRGDLDEARSHYSRAIEQAGKDGVPSNPNQSQYLALTHVEVARIWALRASGRDCLGGAPGRVDRDEAATHVANALASLRMAAAFGFKNQSKLAQDPAFSGLLDNDEFRRIAGAK